MHRIEQQNLLVDQKWEMKEIDSKVKDSLRPSYQMMRNTRGRAGLWENKSAASDRLDLRCLLGSLMDISSIELDKQD